MIDFVNTCCFFGHRKINKTQELKNTLYNTVENLIANEQVYVFLFGSKSEFDDLCHETVTQLKEKYPQIKRIYIRAEYQYINDEYKNFLLESYEDTYFPEHIENSGRASYVERNMEMIDNSDFCVVYYEKNYLPPRKKSKDLTDYQPKSGTRVAYNYAVRKKKKIINLIK